MSSSSPPVETGGVRPDHEHESEHDHGSSPGHDHDQVHEHDREHDHDHDKGRGGILGWLAQLFTPHSHSHYAAALDPAMANARGMRAIKVSLVVLLATAIFQVFIVAISGSVALLADTIHNFSDALTAIPLGLAFWVARRPRNSRYTYGYGRAEDIAGVLIVIMILLSALEAIYQSIMKLIHPEAIQNLNWVAVAAIVGFIGNELVAVFRIRVGKQIGSAALVADGYHARTDGFTSLAVLAGAIGVWLGFPLLDPIIGLGIGAAILVIVWNAARDMALRMMDAVDPQFTQTVIDQAAAVAGVQSVQDAAIRWVGHRQRTELHITVDCSLPTRDSHHIAEEVRHKLFHALPALIETTVHVDPCECELYQDHHHHTAHHVFPPEG